MTFLYDVLINTRKHKNKVITQNKLLQNASKLGMGSLWCNEHFMNTEHFYYKQDLLAIGDRFLLVYDYPKY